MGITGSKCFHASIASPARAISPIPSRWESSGRPAQQQQRRRRNKDGLYFSYDGGTNWSGPCTTNSFATMRQDVTGLALIDNGSSTRVVAAIGARGFATTVQSNLNQNGANGIYAGTLPASGCPADFAPISTNANGWAGLNPASGTAYGGSGVGDQLGRIDLAVAPSNTNYIYAQVQAIAPNSNGGCGTAGCQLGAYRTTDGGATWMQIPGSPGNSLDRLSRCCGGLSTELVRPGACGRSEQS